MNEERNDRADAAKANDDSGVIDRAQRGPAHGGTAGGNLQRDVASRAEEDRVRDPEARRNVTKSEKLEHAEASVEPRTASSNSGGGDRS